VHQTILMGAVEMQSTILPVEHQADFETFRQGVYRIQCLASDLHTIAHKVARHSDCPFYDDPQAGIKRLFAAGEDVRDEMAAKLAGTTVVDYIAKMSEEG
jgi:hypothetical protein